MKNGCKTLYNPHCKIMYTNDIIYSSVLAVAEANLWMIKI